MDFKQYAKKAKKRLQEGFWEEVKVHREQAVKRAESEGRSAYPLLVEHKEKLRNRLYSEDFALNEKFEKKVIEMLESGRVLPNPIAYLADREAMSSMTPSAKQRYLLKLSAQYREIADSYYKRKI